MPRTVCTILIILVAFVALTGCGSSATPAPTTAPAAPTIALGAATTAPVGRGAPLPLPAQPTAPSIPTKVATPFVTATFSPIISVPLATKQASAPATAAAPPTTSAGSGGGGPAAPGIPTGVRSELKVEFIKALGTAEDVDEIALQMKRIPGIFAVTGNEVGVTVTYDAGLILPNQVRAALASLGHEVKP